jgi:hypothetical protein
MGANPNTMTLKTVYDDVYAITHYKQPVYRAFADEKLAPKLSKGNTISRSYASSMIVKDMGADGSYSTQAIADTAETLVINYEKESSMYIKELDLEQAHLDVKMKYARKQMNELFLQIDSDVLYTMYAGVGSTVDDGTIGGTAGNGIAISPSNVMTVFSAAQMQLQLQNVVYEPNKQFTGEVKLENVEGMPVCAISPNFYQSVVQYLGGKASKLGDDVARNGYAMYFMGFNIFVSNNLAFTTTLTAATLMTSGDIIQYGDIYVKIVASGGAATSAKAGTAAAPVEVALVSTSVANSLSNLADFFNSPFATAGAATYSGLVDNAANRKKMSGITATAAATSIAFVVKGKGSVYVTQTMTAAANKFGSIFQHNIFGVSNSVSVVIQHSPSLFINPASGKVGKDYVTWTAYGIKVFVDQAPMLIDVVLDASQFGSTAQPVIVNK